MYQTVVCLFLVFLWERERLWWNQKKKQTNSVIELCLVPSAVTVIVLTFHKRNKINRCYKIQAYCSTFSSRPLDPICHIWLNLNWGRTILGKLTFFLLWWTKRFTIWPLFHLFIQTLAHRWKGLLFIAQRYFTWLHIACFVQLNVQNT